MIAATIEIRSGSSFTVSFLPWRRDVDDFTRAAGSGMSPDDSASSGVCIAVTYSVPSHSLGSQNNILLPTWTPFVSPTRVSPIRSISSHFGAVATFSTASAHAFGAPGRARPGQGLVKERGSHPRESRAGAEENRQGRVGERALYLPDDSVGHGDSQSLAERPRCLLTRGKTGRPGLLHSFPS